MKKAVVKMLAVVMVLTMVCAVLASCAETISGTYEGSAGLGDLAGGTLTYKFSGSKVTLTVTTKVLGVESSNTFDGTYEIIKKDDGSKQIKFTFGDDGSKYSGTVAYEKVDDGVKIGGVTYKKK